MVHTCAAGDIEPGLQLQRGWARLELAGSKVVQCLAILGNSCLGKVFFLSYTMSGVNEPREGVM